MGNLNIGSSVISIKDAIKNVESNIAQLQQKKNTARGYASDAIIRFYDEKLSVQESMLSWLKSSLS